MKNIKEKITETICQIPKNFRELQNKSVYDLLKDSEYFERPDSITMETIENYLINHKNLIDYWLVYSMDKRTSSGWYIIENTEKTRYTVGFLNNGKREKENNFNNAVEACETFIINEIDDIKNR